MLKSERQGKHMLLHLAYRAIVSFAEGTVASCGDVHHPNGDCRSEKNCYAIGGGCIEAIMWLVPAWQI